jgi:hypothetical protein
MPLTLLSEVLFSIKSWTHILCTVGCLKGALFSWEEHWSHSNLYSFLVDEVKLDGQTSFFKMTMMFNVVITMKPHVNCNPCSKVWALFANNQIISHKLFE